MFLFTSGDMRDFKAKEISRSGAAILVKPFTRSDL